MDEIHDEEVQEMFDTWERDFRESLPKRFVDVTFDSFDASDADKAIGLKAVCDWADDAPRTQTGLFLTGPVGTGKTHLALAAACSLIKRRGWRTRYIPVQEYLEQRRASFSSPGTKVSDPRRLVTERKLVILDDIGVEKPSEWVREQVFALVDAAYNQNVILLVTSNNDYSELSAPEALGERTTSRLVEITDKIVVGGDDWRKRRHMDRKGPKR